MTEVVSHPENSTVVIRMMNKIRFCFITMFPKSQSEIYPFRFNQIIIYHTKVFDEIFNSVIT